MPSSDAPSEAAPSASAAGAPLARPESASRVAGMTALGVGLGLLSHGIFNTLRRRPVSFQPWYFVINGLVAGATLNHAAHVYDDVTETLRDRFKGFARLPTWVHDRLSPEELGACARWMGGGGGLGFMGGERGGREAARPPFPLLGAAAAAVGGLRAMYAAAGLITGRGAAAA